MSRLPASDIEVLLAPDGLHAGRAAWSWRGVPRRTLRDGFYTPAASWQAALAALECTLQAQARPVRLHVTLSNRLVRYAPVPWQAGLNAAAAQAYQRDCFVRLYGDAALEWHVAATPQRHGAGLASAVDAALVDGIQSLCRRTGTRLASLRPQLAAVVNRWRHLMRAECFWLVLAEPGYLCLALAQQRTWRAVRPARTGRDALAGLAPLLERETLLADTDAAPTQVYLWAPGLESADADEVAGLPVTRLAGDASDPLAAMFACEAGR